MKKKENTSKPFSESHDGPWQLRWKPGTGRSPNMDTSYYVQRAYASDRKKRGGE